MNDSLRKFVAPEIVLGKDSRLLISQYIGNFGLLKPLIVTGKVIEEQFWYKDIIDEIEGAGFVFEVFDDVTINPKDYECHNGAKIYRENICDSIIAIGGGSVLDCAKGIGILVSNEGDIKDYEGVDKVESPIPPIICIPTTAGSSADVSQFAIITNTEDKYKMAQISKMLVPDLSLIDPLVTLTMDNNLTFDTAIDALVHGIESYVSILSSFITDGHALSAIKRIVTFLPKLMNNLDSLEYRSEIMWSSLEAGLAFSNASLGLVHAIAHSIGGYKDYSHGKLNGIFLEHVIKHNYDVSEKYHDIEAVFIECNPKYKGLKLYEMINVFIDSIYSEIYDVEFKLSVDEIKTISKFVMGDPCILTNPKDVEYVEVVKMIEKIFK